MKKPARTPISEADYFLKSDAFRVWLQQERDKYLDELGTADARRYFAKFVRRWNDDRLPAEYYDDKVKLAKGQGTRYQWAFAANGGYNEPLLPSDHASERSRKGDRDSGRELERERDRPRDRESTRDRDRDRERDRPSTSSSRRDPADDDDLRDRDRHRHRSEARDFRRRQDAVLDELVPKPDNPRERAMEKRRATTAFHRQDNVREADYEFGDDVLLGSGREDLEAAKRREAAARERREQSRRPGANKESETPGLSALDQMRAKEAATMAALKAMAAKRFSREAKMARLELVEAVLIQAVLLDPHNTDPLPLLRVGPNLTRLRDTVLCHSLHARMQRAFYPEHEEFRDLLLAYRENVACDDEEEAIFYFCLLCAAGTNGETLDDYESYRWLWQDLDLYHPDSIVAAHGHDELLDYMFDRGYIALHSNHSDESPHPIVLAAKYGHVGVFDFYVVDLQYILRIPNLPHPADVASAHGHVDVLEWLSEAGFMVGYTARAIDDAVQAGHADVLDWWKDSGLDIKVSESSLHYTIENDDADLVLWLVDFIPEFDGSRHYLNKLALEAGSLRVVAYNDLDYSWYECIDWDRIVKGAVRNKHINVLKWVLAEIDSIYLLKRTHLYPPDLDMHPSVQSHFEHHVLPLYDRYDHEDDKRKFWIKALHLAIARGDADVLAWFRGAMPTANFDLLCDPNDSESDSDSDSEKPDFWAEAIKFSSRTNNVTALAWYWSNLTDDEFICPGDCGYVAPSTKKMARAIARLDWWLATGLQLEYSYDDIRRIFTEKCDETLVSWWRAHVCELQFDGSETMLELLAAKIPDVKFYPSSDEDDESDGCEGSDGDDEEEDEE
ncbi:hypothetical protein H9P43_007778 [Blastocladiella emersonii ATCC 22665]|nr:hypothetical protein H9P43_007778 [Blastocladiella emersonii ATCC 22665]